MENKPENNKGPVCACGKVDLYGEWLKQNEEVKPEDTSTAGSKTADPKSSSDDAVYVDSKPVHTDQ